MASISAKIKKAEKLFKGARKRAKEEKGFAEIPDGKYIGVLTEFEIGESQSSDRLQSKMGYKIQEGEYTKEVARNFNGLEDEDQIMYFARDLNRLGFEMPDSMEELEDLGKEMLKERIVVRFTLRTKSGSEFQNLFLNKVLTGKDYGADDDGTDVETPPAPSEFPSFSGTKGDRVKTEIDGDNYEGVVAGMNDDDTEVYIEFDDGDKQYIPVEDVQIIEQKKTRRASKKKTSSKKKVEEPVGLDVGDRVIAEIDDSEYAGEITEMDGTVATVRFDDGDTDQFDTDDLTAEEGGESSGEADPDDSKSEFEVEKGMSVEVKIGRKTVSGSVSLVSSTNETINIKDDDGNLHKNIPIEKIVTVFQDD